MWHDGWPIRCDDGSLDPPGPLALRDYIKFMDDGLAAYGFDLHAIAAAPAPMRDAGFQDCGRGGTQ